MEIIYFSTNKEVQAVNLCWEFPSFFFFFYFEEIIFIDYL